MILHNYWQAIRSFNHNVRLFLLSAIVIGFTFDGGIALLLNLYLLRLGYGPEFVGLVNAIGLLTFALSSLPSGMLGQRLGSRRIILLGYVLVLLGGGLLPLAEFGPTHWQAGWLIVSFAFLNLGLSFVFVNGAPYLMTAVSPKNRNVVFAVQSAVLSLSAFAGSLLGGLLPGWLAAWLGLPLDAPAAYRYPLLLGALLVVLAIWIFRQTTEVAAKEAEIVPPVLASPTLVGPTPVGPTPVGPTAVVPPAYHPLVSHSIGLVLMIALVRLLQVSGMGTVFTFFNVYFDEALRIPTAQIGFISSLGRLLAVPAALSTSYFATRWGTGRVVVWASLIVSACIIPLALVPNWLVGGAAYVGTVTFTSMRFPAYQVFALELVPPEKRATVNGANEMAAGLSFSLMALGGGYIITLLGYQALFLLGAGLTAVGTLIFWLYFWPHQTPALLPVGD